MDAKHSSVEALRRITRALDVHSRALLQKHDLTGPQLSVLKELARSGQAPIGALAKSTYLGAPTVTGIVDRLERHGWVTRVPGKEDRRQVLITISAAGKRTLERSPPLLMDTFCRKLLRCPHAEQQQIGEVLQKVADMIEQSALNGESRHEQQTSSK
jgi:DNA-binding MarR family transcriptional regulator